MVAEIIMYFTTPTPSLLEAYNDRLGDVHGRRKDTDLLPFTIIAIMLGSFAALLWSHSEFAYTCFEASIVFGMCWVWRLFFFDYLMNILLYKNKVIEGDKAKRWFYYTGKSAPTDRWWNLLIKNAYVRFAIRVVVFTVYSWGYFYYLHF